MNHCRACVNQTEFSCWKNDRAKTYPRQNSGRSVDRKPTVQRRFSFSPLSGLRYPEWNDSLYLQSVLADWPVILSVGLSGENAPARRLPRESRTALRNLRSASMRASVLEETGMAARRQRW